MKIDSKSARIIGDRIGLQMMKAHLQLNAKELRLSAACALYGMSLTEMQRAMNAKGTARLRVKRRKREDGKGRMVLVERAEMERWIADNFELEPENENGPEERTLPAHKANMNVVTNHEHGGESTS